MILRDAIPHRFVTRQCERSTGDGRILRRRAACRGDARLRARPGSGRARGGRVPPVPLTDDGSQLLRMNYVVGWICVVTAGVPYVEVEYHRNLSMFGFKVKMVSQRERVASSLLDVPVTVATTVGQHGISASGSRRRRPSRSEGGRVFESVSGAYRRRRRYIDILYLMKAADFSPKLNGPATIKASVRRSYFNGRDKLGQKEGIPRLPNWVMGQLCRYLPPLFLFGGGSDVLLNTKGKIFRKIFDKVAATRSRCAGIMLGLRAGGGRRAAHRPPAPSRTEL
ncbi:hypothetical protein EVAR_76028_1 [Eumeta japonica]|uniref:Uncharacterized protein n=1 Tax=Eumeta variegata TaxID=151549 RepID=A0A4C1UA47_EUMVA|nr:hypothetical protein EVAR_76028_1 [Eumeta japonica]